MFDVIVVGAGPGGSVAAKKCAEHGLKALLLEKKKLPRDKVCSGMVMGPLAKDIIREEFGKIPREVLVAPYYLSGYMLHVPGAEPQKVDNETFLAWRKDLDYWMTQSAKGKGAEVWDEANVIAVERGDRECTVMLKKGGEQRELKARFVIGADGANSVVRKSVFPELQPKYTHAYRECYKGELSLDQKYFHWFFPTGSGSSFSTHRKGDLFLIEGRLKELRPEMERILGDYGFDPKKKPLWRDGCISRAGLQKEVFSGSFLPARGNVLLVGDASVLKIYISGEGIGTALKCGVLAAASIVKASAAGEEAATIYLKELQPLTDRLRAHYRYVERVREEAPKGPRAASDALREGFAESLTIV